jgi:hypothetical protein
MNVGANRQLSGEYGGRYMTSSTGVVYGNFTKIHAVSASTISITSSNITDATSVTLAQGQEFNGRVSALSVSSGAIIAYNATATSTSYTTTTNKAAFVSTDYLDWSAFGVNGTIVQPGQSANSNLGNKVTNISPEEILRVTQGITWSGNFTNLDELVYSFGQLNISVQFSRKVNSVGFQVQSSDIGTYYAGFEAYDDADILVGSVSSSGTSDRTGSGLAMFLGIVNSNQCIKKVVIHLNPPTTRLNRFAINRLLLA